MKLKHCTTVLASNTYSSFRKALLNSINPTQWMIVGYGIPAIASSWIASAPTSSSSKASPSIAKMYIGNWSDYETMMTEKFGKDLTPHRVKYRTMKR